jgi:SAM-dependent methyltransferase
MKKYGPESDKAHDRRLRENFYTNYLIGSGLDIGYKGSLKDADPIWNATGIELDYPGYDGKILPFPDNSQDFVYNSHCLEHIADYKQAIREWYRVIKTGGFFIITVPHQFLYEKKLNLPSRYNGDHKRFYTPASLMKEVEESLIPNSYRVEYLKDCDEGYDYSVVPETHACGEYQIELVLKKIQTPTWIIK